MSNWVGFATQVAVTFFLTPFVLAALGPERYGVWALVVAVTGYYGLLDLGFRSGLTQYLTRYLATGDSESLNRTASTGFTTLTCAAVVVLVGGIITALAAPQLFQLPPSTHHETRVALVIISCAVATQFSCFTFSALLTAVQRFDIANGIGILTRLATAAATVVALSWGGGLIVLSIITAVSNALDYGLRCAAAFRLVPALKVRLGRISMASASELFRWGLWAALIQGSVRLMSYANILVVGVFMQAGAVTPFALAASLASYFSDFVVPVVQVFFPVFAGLDAKGNRDGIRLLYSAASRLMLLLAATVGILLLFFAREFFEIWVGAAVGSASPYGSAASIFQVLVIGAIVTAMQRVGCQVLMGMLLIRLLAALFAAEAALNLLLSIVLIGPVGLIGVALGTTVPALFFGIWLHPYFICRSLGLPVRTYWSSVLPRPLLAGSVLAGVLYLWGRSEPSSRTWLELAFRFGWASLLACLAAVALGLRADERERFLVSPLRSLLRPPMNSGWSAR